jgi:hypothetical protein
MDARQVTPLVLQHTTVTMVLAVLLIMVWCLAPAACSNKLSSVGSGQAGVV